ncbi:MAG: toll/interleukin-1 receptor domain-containing protein [Planctomycetes bacterium]|nr:toll/interleukin-1 receptor domain-containing protein [Planctomycetota bacterium]
MATQQRDKVFICYAHDDKPWVDRILKMASPLVRNKAVEFWWDRNIKTGRKWRDEIGKGLDSAKVALLMVSQSFLASDFIIDEELPKLLKAHQDDGATIFWILLEECMWEKTPIAVFQAAHVKPPLDDLEKDQQALNKAIKAICEKLHACIDASLDRTEKRNGRKSPSPSDSIAESKLLRHGGAREYRAWPWHPRVSAPSFPPALPDGRGSERVRTCLPHTNTLVTPVPLVIVPPWIRISKVKSVRWPRR